MGPDAPAEVVAALKGVMPGAPSVTVAAGAMTPAPAAGSPVVAVGAQAAHAAAKAGHPFVACAVSDLRAMGLSGKGTAVGVTHLTSARP